MGRRLSFWAHNVIVQSKCPCLGTNSASSQLLAGYSLHRGELFPSQSQSPNSHFHQHSPNLSNPPNPYLPPDVMTSNSKTPGTQSIPVHGFHGSSLHSTLERSLGRSLSVYLGVQVSICQTHNKSLSVNQSINPANTLLSPPQLIPPFPIFVFR